MNVLVLTPDAVGSTLLQRLITIYMQFHEFDRPVINLHELTNGLEKYYSPDFNREIISKKKVKSWGYYQTLEQIVELLGSTDHYKIARLAQYHILGRQDPIEQQIPFYRYLNDNFFVISCRRNNVFENALSLSINAITKRLNVYDHQEKIDAFIGIYRDRVQIDQHVFVSKLESFKEYIKWSQDHFDISSYFYYDEHVHDIERYILDLPIFHGQPQRVTWQQKFDISFDDWNRVHFMPSDLGALSAPGIDAAKLCHNGSKQNAVALLGSLTNSIVEFRGRDAVDFLEKNKHGYESACKAIERMQGLDIIASPPPIKKQTLQEKIQIIKNFDQCLEIYNQWIVDNPNVGTVITDSDLQQRSQQEQQYWRSFNQSYQISDQRTIEKLGYQNDDDL